MQSCSGASSALAHAALPLLPGKQQASAQELQLRASTAAHLPPPRPLQQPSPSHRSSQEAELNRPEEQQGVKLGAELAASRCAFGPGRWPRMSQSKKRRVSLDPDEQQLVRRLRSRKKGAILEAPVCGLVRLLWTCLSLRAHGTPSVHPAAECARQDPRARPVGECNPVTWPLQPPSRAGARPTGAQASARAPLTPTATRAVPSAEQAAHGQRGGATCAVLPHTKVPGGIG